MPAFDDFMGILRREPIETLYPKGPERPQVAQLSPRGDGLLVHTEQAGWSLVPFTGHWLNLSLPDVAVQARSAIFSGDGRFLLFLGASGETILKILDGPDRNALIMPGAPEAATTACTFMGESAYIVSGFSDGAVAGYDDLCIGPDDTPKLNMLYRHQRPVAMLRSDAKGSALLTADTAGRVVLSHGA